MPTDGFCCRTTEQVPDLAEAQECRGREARCCHTRATQLPVQRQSPESKDRSRLVLWRDLANGEMLDNKRGQARCVRRLPAVAGFSEGVPPESTPQRLCLHSPVRSKNDGWPTTKFV